MYVKYNTEMQWSWKSLIVIILDSNTFLYSIDLAWYN